MLSNKNCLKITKIGFRMSLEDSQIAVSLLVPIYNVEKYLRECLDSAAAQTLKNIEIICINDGSRDSSRDIIQEYLDADSRFRVIDKENSGYGISMNMGIEAAQGEYIGILESDDFIDADELKTLYDLAKKYDADVVKSNFNFYWSVPEPREEFYEYSNKEMCDHVFAPVDEPNVFYMKPSIWSAIYKRSFLNNNQIRFLETPGASYQDAGFNFKVWLAAKRAYCIHDAFLHYRQDNEASSVNSPGKMYCVCDEYAEMFSYLDIHFPELKERMLPVLIKMQYDTYMWNYERLSPELRKEFIERFSNDFKEYQKQGQLDFSYFEPWKPKDCKLIIDDPMLFHAMRSHEGSSGAISGTLYYMKHGGVGALKRMLEYKKEG